MSTASLTSAVERGHRQLARGLGQLADEPQAGQRLAGRAGVDGRVPLHARRQREQQRQGLTVTDLADDGDVGRHAQEAGDQPAQVDLTPVGARRTRLHRGDVRQRDVGLEDLLGDDDPQRGVELGRAARQQRRLARAGRAGEDDREPGADARPKEVGDAAIEHVPLDQLVERSERDAGELADVDDDVAAAGDVAVHDVEPGPVVELGVLKTLGRVELAVRCGGVVEDLGEGAKDVVVVVEDLVVVAAPSAVALHEDLVGCVDHHLPDVVVGEERFERAVAGEVAVSALRDDIAVNEIECPQATLELGRPRNDLVVDDGPELSAPILIGHVERDLLRPELHAAFDLLERCQGHRTTVIRRPPAQSNCRARRVESALAQLGPTRAVTLRGWRRAHRREVARDRRADARRPAQLPQRDGPAGTRARLCPMAP